MLTAALLLVLAAPGAPAPTPTPAPTPKAAPAPTLSREKPAASGPTDLSSFAGKVKVDRSKANDLFKQDGPAPAEPARTETEPSAKLRSAGSLRTQEPSSSEEASWRSRASSLRRDLDRARDEKAATERNLPPAATSSEGTAQRNTLLYRYQVRIDRAQAALDALADECRQAPGCQPGWVR